MILYVFLCASICLFVCVFVFAIACVFVSVFVCLAECVSLNERQLKTRRVPETTSFPVERVCTLVEESGAYFVCAQLP